MAPKNDSERLNQALQDLRAARGELSAEARSLREKLSPSRAAHRALDRHTPAVLGTAFATGLATAWLILHKSRKPSPAEVPRDAPHPGRRERFSPAGFSATLAKAAVPFLFKFATSKPILTTILNVATQRRAHPARHAAA